MNANGQNIAFGSMQNPVCGGAQQKLKTLPAMTSHDHEVYFLFLRKSVDFGLGAPDRHHLVVFGHTVFVAVGSQLLASCFVELVL